MLPECETTKAIFRHYETQEQRFGSRLGASQIGHECSRCLWLSFRWAIKKQFGGRMLRLFETGHLEEARVVQDLRNAGVIVHDVNEDGNQFTFTAVDGHFVCKVDGAILGIHAAPKTWHVLEVKSSNDKGFQSLSKSCVKDAKYQHYAQVQIGMHLSGMERAFYIVVNKNTDDIYTERVPYDPSDSQALIERARDIIYDASPPERIGGPAYFACKWCDYYGLCHGDMLPEANCRTCCHITPRPGPAWTCEKKSITLDDDRILNSCDDHLWIPTMVNAQASLQYDGCVVYTAADGTRFCNTSRNKMPNVDDGYYQHIAMSRELGGKSWLTK